MIEVKTTKVKLYTVKELKSYYNITVLIPEIERILELSKDKEIILISQLARIGRYPRYAAAIPMEDCYEFVIINSNLIREVIGDKRNNCVTCRHKDNKGSVCSPEVNDYSCWESVEIAEPPMKYKVGDRVLIKKYKDLLPTLLHPIQLPDSNWLQNIAGLALTIKGIGMENYIFKDPNGAGLITLEENFIERLVDPVDNTVIKGYNELKSMGFHVDPDKQSPELIEKLNPVKPPLGLTPLYLYKEMAEESRMRELFDAMMRYSEKKVPIPVEWIEELGDRVENLGNKS